MEFFEHMGEWQRLVHVCQRWRQIIYASPRYLDLLLYFSEGTPVKGLSCWPPFPIAMSYCHPKYEDEDDAITLLKHSDRVHFISLSLYSLQLGKVVAAMQEPFPLLTHLKLSAGIDVPVLPAGGFLVGSAPCLRLLELDGIPFPELPMHLLSFRDLVSLHLGIPSNGYISPEAMVAGLAVLSKLQTLRIQIWTCGRPFPEQRTRHPDPLMRVVLPALTSFLFESEHPYVEDFLAQIDTPRLNSISITYCNMNGLSVPQLSEFLNRSDLKLTRFGDAKIYFDHSRLISFCFHHGVDPDEYTFAIRVVSEEGMDNLVWDMAQVLDQISARLSDVDRLEINAGPDWQLAGNQNMDNTHWVKLLLPFTAVETLRVSEEFAESVADAFQEMTVSMATQVLPALGSLYLEGQLARTVKKIFIFFKSCGRLLTIIGHEGVNSEGSDSETDRS
jgi:hypothetical protein